jgi:hypothetical protein
LSADGETGTATAGRPDLNMPITEPIQPRPAPAAPAIANVSDGTTGGRSTELLTPPPEKIRCARGGPGGLSQLAGKRRVGRVAAGFSLR